MRERERAEQNNRAGQREQIYIERAEHRGREQRESRERSSFIGSCSAKRRSSDGGVAIYALTLLDLYVCFEIVGHIFKNKNLNLNFSTRGVNIKFWIVLQTFKFCKGKVSASLCVVVVRVKWFSACNRNLIVEIMRYIFVCNKCMDHFCIFYVFVFVFYCSPGAQKPASYVRHGENVVWFQKRLLLLDPTRLPHGELIHTLHFRNKWMDQYLLYFFCFCFLFYFRPEAQKRKMRGRCTRF